MASKDAAEDGIPTADDAAAPKSKFKKIAIIAVALIAVSGGGAWFFLLRGGHDEAAHAEAPAPKAASFVEVPDILVNLSGQPGERVQYLKVKIVLEVKEEKQIETIKPTMPRITDILQTYLRELRPNDLSGSVGMFRLKEELTRRVNAVISPSQVSAVLFKEIFIQ